MQSIFQYRKFRKQVEKQHARHVLETEKPATISRQEQNAGETPVGTVSSSYSSVSSSQSSLPRSSQDGRDTSPSDLEKGTATSPAFEKKDPIPAANEHEPPVAPEAAEESTNLRSDLRSNVSRLQEDIRLSRTATAESHRSLGVTLGTALTGIHVRDRRTHEGTGKVFVVGYEGEDDKMDPHNWSFASRISATMLIAGIGFVVGFASAIDSSALRPASQEFGVSEVTESLATGLYLIGFGAGALFAAPLSETLGRNPYVYSISAT
jgi:hypothetical protein